MIRSVLAALALALGTLAAAVGDAAPGSRLLGQLAGAMERGEGRLGAIELARWVRSRRADLQVVDLRDEEAYGEYHLPGAIRQPLQLLLEAAPDRSRTLVAYAEPGPRAAQAWVLLRARGWPRVYYLGDGVGDWLAAVASPVLPADATPAELAAWPEVRDLSRYFGGMPRRGPRPAGGVPAWLEDPAGTARSDGDRLLQGLRRRGCGF